MFKKLETISLILEAGEDVMWKTVEVEQGQRARGWGERGDGGMKINEKLL